MPTAPELLARHLRDGLARLGAGDPAGAAKALEQALAADPTSADAMQLLGLARRRLGDLDAAEHWLRASLARKPAQPHVWNNLGNVVARRGRTAEAIECFERALALQPGDADAQFNRARLLRTAGRADEAAAALARLLGARPPDARTLHLAALLEGDAGRLDAALERIDAALALAPAQPALHHDRGTLLQRAQRPAEALHALERARELGLDAAELHYNCGNVLQSLGRSAEALAAYRRALAAEPLHALALHDLARLRWRLGDEGFLAEIDAAAAAHPEAPLPHALAAQLLWRAEHWADAAAAYRRALERAPATPALLDGLASALARAGDPAAALPWHAQALAIAPHDAALHVHRAVTLLIAGDAAAAADAAATACRLAPDDQHALAVLGSAWRALGDARERWLVDEQRFVAIVDLEPPAGWPTIAAFNAALAAECAPLHADRRAPVDQTLRHGTQSLGTLFAQRRPCVDALRARLVQAIDAYVAALPADDGHPFLRRRAAGWRFTDSWSSRLVAGGYHTDHVHPHGWISAVYYVELPPSLGRAGSRDGWLRFGVPEFLPPDVLPARRHVEPRAGRLVLFPSMFWHGTVPFDGDGARLTIAFDVLPVAPP